MNRAEFVRGIVWDGSQIEDHGRAEYAVIDGPHAGHILTVSGQKFNSGDSVEHRRCTCGAVFGRRWAADGGASGDVFLESIRLHGGGFTQARHDGDTPDGWVYGAITSDWYGYVQEGK